MAKERKYGKVLLVVFVTVLIWVWTDLALDDVLTVSNVTVDVTKSVNPDMWVSFEGVPSISVGKIVLRGSASRVAIAKRKRDEGSLVTRFFLDPGQEGITAAGRYTRNLRDFLGKNDQIRQLGLTVESCETKEISVTAVRLARKSLIIECVDPDQNLIRTATIDPPQVDMFVPQEWEGEKLTAKVFLTNSEKAQARLAPITKKPYVEIADNQVRLSASPVEIRMPFEEDLLEDYSVTATLGVALSMNLLGEYTVEITNMDEIMGAIAIRATPEAKMAYQLHPLPSMTLYILDDDKKATSEQSRKVVYNFPEEFVRNNEIKLKSQPVEVKFKLILISRPQPAAGSAGL